MSETRQTRPARAGVGYHCSRDSGYEQAVLEAELVGRANLSNELDGLLRVMDLRLIDLYVGLTYLLVFVDDELNELLWQASTDLTAR